MEKQKTSDREKIIVRTSIIGIGANILLVIFKTIVGLAANSIAVVLDAVNNLSDVLSSIITIIGTKLAGKKPDKDHPYGHGRAEYMSQLIVAGIILYAGITSGVESAKKIISPEIPDYSAISLIVIGVAVFVKLGLGLYVKAMGKRAGSGTLEASGTDALFDSIISASVFASAVIFILTGVSLEAYVGLIIAVFIIKSGVEMIKDAVDDMLGRRPDAELTEALKKEINSAEGVRGVYDLIVHNYGPHRYLASVHVEVCDSMTADEIDQMTRQIQRTVFEKHNVIMTAVGIYSVSTGDGEKKQMRSQLRKLVMSHEGVMQFHGFFIDEKSKSMSFDIVIDFAADREKIYQDILREVQQQYPDYQVMITLDNDMSD